MPEEVRTWLESLGLEGYVAAFNENGVDMSLLPELTNDDLKDLGVGRLADRKLLLKAIADLDPTAAAPDRPAAAPRAATPAPGPEGERRQVSILFADICGYTRLSSEIDAEAVHAILSHFFEHADAVVADHGGTVDKHVGDSVMAVFGAPVAHSDDPVRAVRAAMAIHEAMPAISEVVGRPLQVHVGIASGQVVASGVGGDTHYTVTGDSVNLASRLTDAAGPGETLMSAAVQAAVVHAVACDDRGEVAVKGLSHPVHAYAVLGQRNTPAEAPERPLVGRQAELRQILGALAVCLESEVGQVIHLRGEAGIGKTRLTEEFEKTAGAKGFDCHRALVLDFGVGKGQDAIRTLVRSLIAIPSASDEARRLDVLRWVMAEGLLDPHHATFLYDLLDLAQADEMRSLYDAMDNEARNRGKRETVAALIRALSARRPLFLIIEDIHWASPLVLEYLAEMTRAVCDQRAVLVMTSRVEGDPIDRTWRATTGAASLTTIDLRPLRREDALALAREYFDASQQYALSCIERADGNPLFLEQLLRSAETARDEQVPGSVQSIIQARLDALQRLDKQALQAASVLGQRFSLDALRHLIDAPQYTCATLIERYLVRPQGDDFLFAHALVQEGVYASLLTARRAALHRAAASWYGERDLELRAQHLDRAGDPEASAAYLAAAKAQGDALRFETALQLADRSLALAGDDATRYTVTCLRGDTLRILGATMESIAAFESALDFAADDIQRCRAWIGMAGGLRIADQQAPALEMLDKAQAVAEGHDMVPELAQIHYLRGNLYFPLGNIDGCLGEHEKSLRYARRVGTTEGEALALGGLGDGYYLRGHMRSSCEQFRACVELCRAHGHGRIEVANRHMVGWTRLHLMEFEAALQDGLDAARLAAEVSHQRAELLGLALAGRVEVEMGRFNDAETHLAKGLDLTRAIGAGNFEAQFLLLLACVHESSGRLSRAREIARQAVEVVHQVGMTFIGPAVLAIHARLTEDPGERKRFLRRAEDILDTGCVAHNHVWFAQVAIDLALAGGDWAEAERYAARLEAYTRQQPLEWPEFMIARGRALAAWGRGGRGADLVAEIERLRDLAARSGLAPVAAHLDGLQPGGDAA